MIPAEHLTSAEHYRKAEQLARDAEVSGRASSGIHGLFLIKLARLHLELAELAKFHISSDPEEKRAK